MGSNGGKASKYKPEYIKALRAHFDLDAGVDSYFVNPETGKTSHFRKAIDLPMYETFAREIGVSRETVKAWADAVDENGDFKYPEFRAAHEEAKGHQARILVQNALMSGYAQSFAIFTAKNILGWRDAVSLEHTGAGGGPVKTINATMSPQEAAEAYAETLRGGAKK